MISFLGLIHQSAFAGRSQYEWTILSRLFTRSFFAGYQCLSSLPRPLIDNHHQKQFFFCASRDIAILCFTFGGGATSDFQQLQVKANDKAHVLTMSLQGYDLASNCDHVWTMSGLLGTQYHVVRSVNWTESNPRLKFYKVIYPGCLLIDCLFWMC